MEDKAIKGPLNTKILWHRKFWMCRMPEAAKDFEGVSQSATQLLFMILSSICYYPVLVKVVKPHQPLSWVLQCWTGIISRMVLAHQWPVGFGRRWHCHSPGSEGCWVLIFAEERHQKNLWRIWFNFQSNLNSAQQIQPGTTHRDTESNSSFSPFKAKASWEKHFLKLDPATL